MRTLWTITILAVVLTWLVMDKVETMVICWQADHNLSLYLAPPIKHKPVKKEGRAS